MDNLIVCKRCGSNACYTKEVSEDVKTYQCYVCGFTTNDLMKRDSDFFETQMEKLPKLYKELMGEDEDGLIWMPSTVNIANKGMIFANGKNGDKWKWSAVLAVPVLDEEKEKYPIPNVEGEYYKWRMDMDTIKNYQEKDYMDALEYIGIFKNGENEN